MRLTIGQIARRAGVGIETVRFYEREGLLAPPARRPSGYREYSDDVVSRLRSIRGAKSLGFSLKEIKELLALRGDPEASCADVKQRAGQKLTDIEEKIRTLQKMRRALVKLMSECSGSGPLSECPILEAFEHEPVRDNLRRGVAATANTNNGGLR